MAFWMLYSLVIRQINALLYRFARISIIFASGMFVCSTILDDFQVHERYFMLIPFYYDILRGDFCASRFIHDCRECVDLKLKIYFYCKVLVHSHRIGTTLRCIAHTRENDTKQI